MRKLGIFLCGVLLLSCSSKSSDKIRLALDWTFNTNHIGILVAKENGFYQQKGLDVDFIEYGKTGSTALLMSNQVELALSSQGELTFAKDEEAPLISVATLLQHNVTGFYSLKKNSIHRPQDLQNKVYGGWGSVMEEAIIRALLILNGVAQPQFENKMIGSMNIRSALANVDFIWGYQGWQGAQLDVEQVDYNFLPVAQYIPALDDYSPIILINQKSDFTKRHQQKIIQFLKATSQGYQWAVQHPEGAKDIMLKYDSTLNADMIQRSLGILLPQVLTEDGKWGIQSEKRYQDYLSFVKEHHLITQDLKANMLMTNEYLEF